MAVWINIKEKINKNELYKEKNRGPACVPRFVSVTKKTSHLISTKWEPQSEGNKYIKILG